MLEQALCQQHLSSAENTSPAAVGGQRAASQLSETPSVRQPQQRCKGATEMLPVHWHKHIKGNSYRALQFPLIFDLHIWTDVRHYAGLLPKLNWTWRKMRKLKHAAAKAGLTLTAEQVGASEHSHRRALVEVGFLLQGPAWHDKRNRNSLL